MPGRVYRPPFHGSAAAASIRVPTRSYGEARGWQTVVARAESRHKAARATRRSRSHRTPRRGWSSTMASNPPPTGRVSQPQSDRGAERVAPRPDPQLVVRMPQPRHPAQQIGHGLATTGQDPTVRLSVPVSSACHQQEIVTLACALRTNGQASNGAASSVLGSVEHTVDRRRCRASTTPPAAVEAMTVDDGAVDGGGRPELLRPGRQIACNRAPSAATRYTSG